MQEILVLLPLFPLALMTLEDLKEKAVSDEINYFMLVFSYIITILLLLIGKINVNSLVWMGILTLSIILFLSKAFAIGDFVLMIWLSVYLAMLPVSGVLLFYVFIFFYGFVISYIYSALLFKKHWKEININKKILLFTGFILAVIGLSYYLYGIFNGALTTFEGINTLLISLTIILVSVIVMKLLEKDVKNMLTFVRTPEQLIEGDWVEYPIIIKGLKDENLKEELRKYFRIEEKDGIIEVYNKDLILNVPGLTRKQIELLKKIQKNAEEVSVKVYEGFPFIPAILLGYLTIIILDSLGLLI